MLGFRGHGKTVYIYSLLFQLDRIGSKWTDFSFTPLDELGIDLVKEMRKKLESGDLPDSSPKMFMKPILLRLEGIPQMGSCQMLICDTSGESIERVADQKQFCSYISQRANLLFIVSLKDLERPSQMADFLASYAQATIELNHHPKEQNLIVVLTKADKYVDDPTMPEEVREFLREKSDGSDTISQLKKLSSCIEKWLSEQKPFINFVRRARVEFKSVHYCVVSALGSEPEGQKMKVAVSPRGVLGPILLAMDIRR